VTVTTERAGAVTTVVLSRPEVRNAVDFDTATALADAFRAFEADDNASVAVLYGDGGTFCAGADLKAVANGRPNRLAEHGDPAPAVSSGIVQRRHRIPCSISSPNVLSTRPGFLPG